MASSTISPTKPKGGSFLIEPTSPEQLFSPEDFTDEHRAIARTTEEFWTKEIAPNVDAIQHQEPGVAVAVLRKAGELGLTSVHLPEKYGGMEMDLTSAMLVAEGIAKDGSYAAWHGGQSGIGALPLLLFGTEDQKQRYLPKVANAEMVAAYALSEPQAGSDALAARTRADLSPDGKHYILNGQKMWITNGGAADLYTIFAKVDGEKFTAFLVERKFPGLMPGAEEKKMGIKGSSTTAIYLDNVPVPVENVLGEIGRGHIIAFNILNIGRLKLGAFALRRREGRAARFAELRQGAQGFRKVNRRVWSHPTQAGRDGDSDLRHRIGDVSRGWAHREPARRLFVGSAQCRSNRAESRGGIRRGMFLYQDFRVGNAGLRDR